ncbi:unnamed protein product [Calypogeia fissa]
MDLDLNENQNPQGDGELQIQNIPDEERLPLPPSSILQGRFSPWNAPPEEFVPDLRGKCPEEVQREASCTGSCIKLGETFESFSRI